MEQINKDNQRNPRREPRNEVQEKIKRKRSKSDVNLESQKVAKKEAFLVNYDFYFRNNQNNFVLQSQFRHVEFSRAKKESSYVRATQEESKVDEFPQELIFKDRKTLVFDFEDCLIRKVDLSLSEEVEELKQDELHMYSDYILIEDNWNPDSW